VRSLHTARPLSGYRPMILGVQRGLSACGETSHHETNARRTKLGSEDGLSFRTSAAAIGGADSAAASANVIDEYLRGIEEPKRSTLQTLRRTILGIVPEAKEVISYGVPAFRVGGQTVAGFAAFKDHLSYLPFSGSVLSKLGDELDGYTMTKSSL